MHSVSAWYRTGNWWNKQWMVRHRTIIPFVGLLTQRQPRAINWFVVKMIIIQFYCSFFDWVRFKITDSKLVLVCSCDLQLYSCDCQVEKVLAKRIKCTIVFTIGLRFGSWVNEHKPTCAECYSRKTRSFIKVFLVTALLDMYVMMLV